jgi:VacB/RNase II family 3'-5' exoribonuclease
MNKHPNLDAIARRVMIEEGFAPDFPPGVAAELNLAANKKVSGDSAARDLRSLLWSSIDNTESRDLDQVEYAEVLPDESIRVMVGIANVNGYVAKGSATDTHAAGNGTSVYTGVRTFPMLPDELSTDLTSLLGDADRAAIVIDVVVGADGAVESSDVYPGLIHNYARLSYSSVGKWLDNHGPIPAAVAHTSGMEEQIRLQVKAMARLRSLREEKGALQFETIQATPVVSAGRVVNLKITERNTARDIIENFMIAANSAMATFLASRKSPSILRVVRSPERWPRIVEIARSFGDRLPEQPDSKALSTFLARRKAADPLHFPDLSLGVLKLLGPGEYVVNLPDAEHEGHFGLAVHDYTHATAPNRRFADLVTQRLVETVTTGNSAPYSNEELSRIAAHCTRREDAARKVERQMRKVAAAVLLADRIGEEFDAVVTGVAKKGTFARLISPPVDGRIIRGERGLDVGDKVRVRLVSTDPERGFIDFTRA